MNISFVVKRWDIETELCEGGTTNGILLVPEIFMEKYMCTLGKKINTELLFVILLAMSLSVMSASVAYGQITMEQKIAVPAYFYPASNGSWGKMVRAAPAVGIVVANPQSGPANIANANYKSSIAVLHQAGIKVLGYVDTGYFGLVGGRSTTREGDPDSLSWNFQIEKDIDTWYALYGASKLDGIFFDDVANTCGKNNRNVSLYTQIFLTLKHNHPDAYVVANPGTNVPECLKNIADTLVTFEGDYHCYISDAKCTGGAGYVPNQWTSLDPRKIWHIVHGTPTSQFPNVIVLSKQRNAGYIFVTDVAGSPHNPYAALPSYFSAEEVAVRKPATAVQ
jgi:hypothetical protein